MTVFDLWLFDEKGVALFYHQWNRTSPTKLCRDEEAKLVYGMLYSLQSFVRRLSPSCSSSLHSYRTSTYRLHYYETPTGLKFVLTTDPNITHPIVRDLLHTIYSQVYVELIVKNPLHQMGQSIESELFTQRVDDIVKASSIFRA